MQWSATRRNELQRAAITGRRELYFLLKRHWLSEAKIVHNFFQQKKSQILKPSLQCPSTLNMNSLKNNNKMETKVVSFEQMPELIQNLVERIEALEKTVREQQQPQPLEGELMSVEDVCKMLGKSNTSQPMVQRAIRQTPTINPQPIQPKKNRGLKL